MGKVSTKRRRSLKPIEIANPASGDDRKLCRARSSSKRCVNERKGVPLFSKYRLRSYSSRHCSQLGQFAHRALFSASSPLIGRFFKAISNSNHGTRLSSSGVCVDRPRTEAWKRSTAYRAQKLWNSLPSDLRGIKNLAAFKIRLKLYNSEN